MSDSLLISLITVAGVILTPLFLALLNDFLSARRERIKDRTKAREGEASALMRAHRDALRVKDQQYEEMREDRDWWRDLAVRLSDGWYGQRANRQ